MRTRTQNKVTGTTHEAGFHHGQQERAQEELQFFDSSTVKVEQTTRGIRFHAKIPPTGEVPSVSMMKVVSYHQDATNGDYLVCRPAGGASDGSNDVYVAVEPQLQSGIVAQTNPDATVWAYTAYVEATQQRTSTQTAGGTAVLTEYISPAFLTTDFVPVQSCANSGVTVDGVTVNLVALTGRQWGSPTSS